MNHPRCAESLRKSMAWQETKLMEQEDWQSEQQQMSP
jgi:hypothetical protein